MGVGRPQRSMPRERNREASTHAPNRLPQPYGTVFTVSVRDGNLGYPLIIFNVEFYILLWRIRPPKGLLRGERRPLKESPSRPCLWLSSPQEATFFSAISDSILLLMRATHLSASCVLVGLRQDLPRAKRVHHTCHQIFRSMGDPKQRQLASQWSKSILVSTAYRDRTR